MVHVITRAKKSTVAYFVPEQHVKRFREQDKVKLMTLFEHPSCVAFTTAKVTLYGTTTTIS